LQTVIASGATRFKPLNAFGDPQSWAEMCGGVVSLGQTIGNLIAGGNDGAKQMSPAEYRSRMDQYNAALDNGATGDQLSALYHNLGLDSVTVSAAPITPVEVDELPPIPGATTLGVPDVNGGGEVQTSIGPSQLTKDQLRQRFWAALKNAQDVRQLPREVTYTFDPNAQYVVQQYRTTGTIMEPVNGTRIFKDTRAEVDDFLSQHAGVVQQSDGSTLSWGELLSETTGANAVTIFAGAVDPSYNDYNVSYGAQGNNPAINENLDYGVWQEVAINSMFHEAYHATEYAAFLAGSTTADYNNEYKARIYSLMHMKKGGYP
jgi:hypothetical protein